MKTWQCVVLGCIGLALAGCRTDPAITMLERDNRIKEDEIYRLRDQVQELEDTLQASTMASAAKSTQAKSAPAKSTTRVKSAAELPPEPAPVVEEGPAITAPRMPIRSAPSEPVRQPAERPTERPAPYGPPPEAPVIINPPVIELPKEPLPKGQIPERLQVPNRTGAPKPLPGKTGWNHGYGIQLAGTAVTPVDNAKVAQITLNNALTGGVGRDGRSNEENLLVVIEPRDLMGEILDAPGNVDVALLDSARPGEAARVGRWDFTAAQTAGMLSGGPDRGIQLNLPWPAGSPPQGQLKLFVRYATRDGRKFQVERPIEIASPGNRLAGDRPPGDRPAGDRPPHWTRVEQAAIPQPAPAETQSSNPVAAAVPTPAEAEPTPAASRPAALESRRPTWSPERRY